MRMIARFLVPGFVSLLAACATTPLGPATASARAEARASVTILISIDGFRPDYQQSGVTPALNALAAKGIQAAMRPSFPTKTFPNHYTLVTGLRPDRNGIVANRMADADRPDEVFTMATQDAFWWDETTPVWVAAEQAGIRTATMFWPGSSVPINGVYPGDWQQFAQAVTNRQRVDAAIDWLRRPAETRPRFVTLYFDTVDTAGHEFGPSASETTSAVADVDGQIGRLVADLDTLGQPANFVIVADHGMAAIDASRIINLDSLADPADYATFEEGTYAALSAVPGHEAALEKRLLAPHDHVTCWRKADIPERLHYGRNPRVQPYLCLPETGWTILSRPTDDPVAGGNHGYDNASPDMLALFIAAGPAILPGGMLPTFDNVDIEPLIRHLIGLPPGQDRDGDTAPFEGMVR